MENFGVTSDPSIQYLGSLTQYFKIDGAINLSVTHQSTIYLAIKKNNDIVPGSPTGMYIKYADQSYNLSGTCVTELSQNDKIQIVVKCDGLYDITFSGLLVNISEFFY